MQIGEHCSSANNLQPIPVGCSLAKFDQTASVEFHSSRLEFQERSISRRLRISFAQVPASSTSVLPLPGVPAPFCECGCAARRARSEWKVPRGGSCRAPAAGWGYWLWRREGRGRRSTAAASESAPGPLKTGYKNVKSYFTPASTKLGSMAFVTALSKSATVHAYSGPGLLQPGTKMGATEGCSAPVRGRR